MGYLVIVGPWSVLCLFLCGVWRFWIHARSLCNFSISTRVVISGHLRSLSAAYDNGSSKEVYFGGTLLLLLPFYYRQFPFPTFLCLHLFHLWISRLLHLGLCYRDWTCDGCDCVGSCLLSLVCVVLSAVLPWVAYLLVSTSIRLSSE